MTPIFYLFREELDTLARRFFASSRRKQSLGDILGILLLAVFWLGGAGGARAQNSPVVPGEIIVGLWPQDDGPDIPLRFAALGVEVGHQADLHARRFRLRRGVALNEALAHLRHRPDVRYAQPNHLLHIFTPPNDPSYSSQYGPQKVKADLAWPLWQPQAQIVLAIVDTGVDGTHPDLVNKMLTDASGIVGYNAFTGQRSNASDVFGHGTHVAGIAAAQTNNGTGIAGIAGWTGQPGISDTFYTKIMPVRVLDSTGSGPEATVADGIVWAANNGAQIISMSLGGPDYTDVMNDAVQYAWSRGCLIVASAGNAGNTKFSYPAAHANVVSVAATDSSDTLAAFSNYGSWVLTAAPGVNVYSTTPTYSNHFKMNYDTLSGTSMACPHVAGEAALLWAQNPALTNAQIRTLLTTKVDAYKPYFSHAIVAGAGRINVQSALLAASAPLNLTAIPANGQVNLAWTAGAGALSYNVKRGTTWGGPYTILTTGLAATAYVDATPPAGPVYYVVSAMNSGGETVNSNEVVVPAQPFLAALSLSQSSVTGGFSVIGAVTLDTPAPTGGAVISLVSSNTAAALAPPSVTVPAGALSVSFPVRTQGVATNTSVSLAATYLGVTRTANLVVVAAASGSGARIGSGGEPGHHGGPGKR